ncbi:MAG TPA: beta-L-arabinofuranosidase domain-containing protein, partial [Thermomicrobiales bacterium]
MSVATRTRSVVVDTSRSANAKIRPVPVDAVTIEDAFWAPRRRQNREATLPSQHRQLWETGRFDNLLRVAGKFDGPFTGRYFNDTDVYKWLEAASWSLAADPDPELEKQVDEAIAVVAEAQRPDGYLNSYFAVERADERWTNADLHELYCAGHLFQAAVAHHRATGSTALLDVSVRFADYLDATFGSEEQGKRVWTDGHPEVEMGLVELARETGEQRYWRLAQFFVDVRGHGLLGDAYNRFGRKYHQDHQPFRELDEIVGHAVRAVYLNAGVADIYAETGEPALGEALHRLWASMTERKMYVSGGIGSRYEGEAFGEDYELPNRLAYTETCAAIGSAMWSWRMLLIEGEARYADLIELQLYNAMLSGVSLDGETYFYQNPLSDEGNHRRSPWFTTACCPPNVARTLASLPGYVYGISDDTIWVHLYAEGTGRIALPNGRTIELRQRTRYPWDGEIEVEVANEGSCGLRLRIPG